MVALKSQRIETGLTQTPFGKKASASDSAGETVKREGAEARGPRRTDACCVSPMKYDRSIHSHESTRTRSNCERNSVAKCL